MRSGFDSLYADSTRFGLGVAAGGKLSHRVGADVLRWSRGPAHGGSASTPAWPAGTWRNSAARSAMDTSDRF
jgi:hypothetical protein